MTHHMIRRFRLEGELFETKMPQVRQSGISLLTVSMKDSGYLPLLDVDPVWQTLYLGGDRYNYVLTLQGVHVGKDVAWKNAGVMDGKLVPSTPKPK